MRGSFGVIAFTLLLSLPADAAPQRPDSSYQKTLALELPILPPPIAVHHSSGYDDRAVALQRGARAVHELIRDSLGLRIPDVTLLVLDSADWSEATELPYGLHTLLQDAPAFLAPAEVDRGIYHDDALGGREAELGVDVVGLHYLAHFYAAEALYGERHRADPPVKWLDELFTLMLQDELLRAVDPALAEAGARQEAESLRLGDPAVTTLAGFDREYRRAFVTREGADDYAWFLARLAHWAREIRGEHGLAVMRSVREALAQAPAILEPEEGLDLLARVGVDVSKAPVADGETRSTTATHCFVLPGSGSGATKSYRVVEGGGIEEAGEVSGGAMHMRAAFHPDGRTLYVSSVGPAGWESGVGGGTWEEGIHVRAYAYEPADCSIGTLLGMGRMGPEAPEINRAYGLEVHPDGKHLYQTTNSLRRIRLFDLPEDRVPVPREEFDVTAGGEHACVQIRRLAMHPSARYLYANCNNGGGVEDALQLWAIEDDGSIALRDHYTFPPLYAGVYDPVVHPSGDWLYQPVGSTSREAAEGIGAILVYRIADDGRLALRDRVAVRATAAAELPPDTGFVGGGPITMVLHPDGGTAYVAVNAVIPEREVFPHGFAIYGVEDGGARLVERAWLPALRETRFSDHHGAILAAYDDGLYLYSFLTDYDTIQGGVLQRLHIADDHSLEPLDPPWVPTGLFDGRQPIAMPGNGRAAEARADTSGTR